MKKLTALLVVSLGLCFIAAVVLAEVKIPGRTNFLVNDYAGVLSAQTKAYLEKLLRDTRGNDFTGTEIVVSTFETLDGMPFEQFMQEYAKKWRRPALLENDNRIHIVLIVKEKKMRIGVGRYVQHIITAEITRDIMDDVIALELRNENYDEGLKKSVETVAGRLKEGNLPKSYTFLYAKRLFLLLILAIFVLAIVLVTRRKL
ncbi:MAG: TPM domain-containing protein [Candidatus Omnitrophota bacterium]|jgi:uncharacterized protein